MSSVDFMNGPQAPPIPPASLAAYFTGLVSFLLADLRSALHSLPHYSSLRSNTKTPPEIYEILRQPTATWAELRKVLQVDRLLLGTLSQSSTLKDAMIGVSVFSVKGGDGWLGMACTSGGWQLVEILSYLGRLRDRVELAVAEVAGQAAASSRQNPIRTPQAATARLPLQYSSPQVHQTSAPSSSQGQPKFSLPNPYEARKAVNSASTSTAASEISSDGLPSGSVSKSKTTSRVRARATKGEEESPAKKKRGRPRKPKSAVAPAKFDDVPPGSSESSNPHLVLDMSKSSNLGKAAELIKSISILEDSTPTFAPPPPPPPPPSASTSRLHSPTNDISLSSATFSPPKPAAPRRDPSPSQAPSIDNIAASTSSTTAAAPPHLDQRADSLSPAISPIARFASPRPRKPSTTSSSTRRPSLDPQSLKGEVYVPSSRESTTDRPKRERKLPERIAKECGLVDEDGNELSGSGEESGRETKRRKPYYEIEAEEDSELSTEGSSSSASAGAREVKERKRWQVGEAAFVRFPNYSWWIATILDPSTAPPETQGRQIRGSYLVKSIPTGADHRWISPDENSIRPIEDEELQQIETSDYPEGKQVPQSWKKWRSDLLDAVQIVKDPERLKEWQSRKTDLEVRIEAEKERRKAVKQMNASW